MVIIIIFMEKASTNQTKQTSLKGFIFDKVPPHDIEVEKSILGCIMYNPEYYIRIAKFFNPKLFYNPTCSVIAQAIYNLNDKNIPIDLITVVKEAMALSKDITAYEVTKMTKSINSFNLEQWFLILIEYYVRRRILSICQMYQIQATDMSKDALVLISELAEKVSEISNMTIYDKSMNADEAISKLLEHIDRKLELKEKFRSIGIPSLDEFLYLDAGQIVMIAGPEGCGKSKLVMHFVKSLSVLYQDFACQYFSFEDSTVSIMKNWLTYETMLTTNQMDGKGYTLTDADKNRLIESGELIRKFDCDIINNACKINDIKTSFINFCRKRPDKFNLLVIDNVMLLGDNDNKLLKGNANDVDDKIARTIKEISMETIQYNSAIIFLHHFNKEASSGRNKLSIGFRPESIDVKGSSRYSDIVTCSLLLNRPGKHKELVACYPGYEDLLKSLTIVEIAKNRNGADGFVRLFTDLAYNIFVTANSNNAEEDIKQKKKRKKN